MVDSGVRAAAITNPRDPRLGRPGAPAVLVGEFRLGWHTSAGARWAPGTGPQARGRRFGPKKSKSTVRDSQLLVRCIPLRSEQQGHGRPAVAKRRLWSISLSAAPQCCPTGSPRALERAGGQKQACGSCAQLLLRCDRVALALRHPKCPLLLNSQPQPHRQAHNRKIGDGVRIQVGPSVASLHLQRLLSRCQAATWRVPSHQTLKPQPL